MYFRQSIKKGSELTGGSNPSLSASQKATRKVSLFLSAEIRRTLVFERMKAGEKPALRSKGLLVCKVARGSEGISNPSLVFERMEAGEKPALRSKGLLVCKVARSSEGIYNPSLNTMLEQESGLWKSFSINLTTC